MVLLLFSASLDRDKTDALKFFCPKPVARTLDGLLNRTDKRNMVGPVLALEAGESMHDPCMTIDMPLSVFRELAPAVRELPHTAHVREVKTDNKETMSYLQDGWFSVVVGNRFPEAEKTGEGVAGAMLNKVFLVSLEGVAQYLKGGSEETAAGDEIRLAVLANWEFSCGGAFAFKQTMDELVVGPFGLKAGAKTDPDVVAGLERGYVALNHTTRLGEKTVSWYRGPLSPVKMERKEGYQFQAAPDGLLRYDYNTGLMDVSYAAAAQLGRLLGLQDRVFSQALDQWRSAQETRAADAPVKTYVSQVLSGRNAVLADSEGHVLEKAFLNMLENEPGMLRGHAPTATWQVDEAAFLEDERGGLLSANGPGDVPEDISMWLAGLLLLYRVPFSYLVPDERLLPPGSMRFFRLDPGWVKCLLEGACSVGRTSTRAELVDQILGGRFLDFALKKASLVRQRPGGPEAANEGDTRWPLEGFLLRSPLVEGWHGLEVRSWEGAEGNRALTPLRIDRLSPDVLLCIFDGRVGTIEISQPPEGMHFGAESDGAGRYRKTCLRALTPDKAGDQIAVKLDVSLREGQKTERVVDLERLAKALKDHVGEVTSAELAVEMTESPGTVTIRIPHLGPEVQA
jgi:hypothetical protein